MISKVLFASLIALGSSAILVSCAQEPARYTPSVKQGANDATGEQPDDGADTIVPTGGTVTPTPSTPVGGTPIPAPIPTPVPMTPSSTPMPAPMPAPTPTIPVPDNSEAAAIKKKCTPEVEYVNDNSAGGKKFAQHVPDAKLAMIQAAHYVCSILYKKASEVPNVTKVKLFLEAMDGVAYATGGSGGKELHISTNYVNGIGGDVKLEIDGVLIHENTHIWQLSGQGSDGGLIEGIADYVRAGGNWYPAGSRNGKGGKYNDAYTTSAYFIGWVNSKYPDFAYKLNLSMKAYPGKGVFQTITGVDADTLWNQYQSQGTFSPKVPEWVAKQVPLQLGK